MAHPLKALLGGKLVTHFGTLGKIYGVNAGLLLAQLCYWDGKGVDPEWSYKTAEEIYNELGMTEAEQKTARKHLVACGVVEEQRKGNRNRLWFHVNLDVLEAHLEKFAQDPKFRAFSDSRRARTFPKKTPQPPTPAYYDSLDPHNMERPDSILCATVHRLPENTTEEKVSASLDANSPTLDEEWDAMPSARDANLTDNGLIPLLAEEKHLFESLNVERTARHYTPFVRFKTTKQREKFRLCVSVFNGSTDRQVDEIIANGKTDIEGVVNALDWRRRNYSKGGGGPGELPPVLPRDAPAVDMSKVVIR